MVCEKAPLPTSSHHFLRYFPSRHTDERHLSLERGSRDRAMELVLMLEFGARSTRLEFRIDNNNNKLNVLCPLL